ncbi:hypothetical protein C0992_006271, partial [Termitomyces sp. T32_za158]
AVDIDMGKLGLRPDEAEEFRTMAAAAQPQIHPPGLSPKDVLPTHTPSSSVSSSSLEQRPLPSLPESITFNPSAPSLHTSTSISTSIGNYPSPHAPPLTASLSSPVPAAPPKVSVGSIFNLRKPSSITIPTNVSSGGAVSATSATTTTAPFTYDTSVHAVPSIPVRAPNNGAEEGSASPIVQSPSSPGVLQRPVTSWSQRHVGTRRTLHFPLRPVTSGNAGGEREKEKEGGWGKWFGGGRSTEPTAAAVNDGADGDAVTSPGPSDGVFGEGDPNAGAHSHSEPNGSAATGSKGEKEGRGKSRKEKGKGPGNWFPKRKSFRIGGGGDKTSKSAHAIANAANAQDVEASSDAIARIRASFQLSRRASDSVDGPLSTPPPMTTVQSTPGVYQQTPVSLGSKNRSPVSTNYDQESSSSPLHHHNTTLTNGEASPAPSLESSFESGDPSIRTRMASVPSSHFSSLPPSYPYAPAQNGLPLPTTTHHSVPAAGARMYSSTSTSTPPVVPTSSPSPHPPLTTYPRT